MHFGLKIVPVSVKKGLFLFSIYPITMTCSFGYLCARSTARVSHSVDTNAANYKSIYVGLPIMPNINWK